MSQAVEDSTDRLLSARAAFEQHDWPAAHEHYRAIGGGRLEPADLERFGEASWWLARLEEAIATRERAYEAYLKAGDRVAAARVALWLVVDYHSRLRDTLARGALARAVRLLADQPESVVHGQLAAFQAVVALDDGDPETAVERGLTAEDIGRRLGNIDLESMGLLVQGRAAVARGEVRHGLTLVERAAAAAVGGELQPFTTGFVYCMTIGSCTELVDYRRAGELTDAAEEWCARQSMPSGFPGVCRVRQAEIRRVQGDWSEAEAAARRAAAELQESFLDTAGQAYNEIGEVRLRLGDLPAAEEAFAEAHALGYDAQPGRSLLRLEQGRPDAALAGIRSALDNPYLQSLGRARLLPALVTIALAAGDVPAAEAGAAELSDIAERYDSPSPVLRAQAAEARARIALHTSDGQVALSGLRAAMHDWRAVRAPYEVAGVRVLLAQAHRLLGDEDAAVLELSSAKAAFERLGAARDLRRVAGLLQTAAPPEATAATFLFTDIVNSTDLLDVLGDEAWTDLRRWHDHTLRELFRAHRGEEVDHAGDGFFVAFDAATSAVDCAVAVQRRLAEHRRDHGFAPNVRIGLHTATALHDAGGYHGKAVHTAARISALADGGQILASRATVEAAGDAVRADGWQSRQLKGLADPVEVGQITWTV